VSQHIKYKVSEWLVEHLINGMKYKGC